MAALSRRELLALAATVVAALPVTRVGAAVAQPLAKAPATLAALARSIAGRLLLPGSSGFDDASTPFDGFVNFGPPAAVLVAAQASDVGKGIAYARRASLPIAVRSGGHNYAGYSTTKGLLISVGEMKQIRVNAKARTVTVGAGAQLINVYNALAAVGQMIPAGTCPTVGVAGHVMGGGFGLSSRKFGLLADNLVSATVVLASGRTVTVSERKNADLFWAIRGGGGGNFCYATEFTFRTWPLGPLSLVKLQYPWAAGRAAFAAWQALIPTMPAELTLATGLLNNAVGTSNPAAMGVEVFGLFHGTAATLRDVLAPVMAAAGTPNQETLRDTTFMEQAFYFGGCDSLQACQSAPAGGVADLDYYVKSSYTAVPYSTSAINTLFTAVENWPGTSRNCLIESFSYGGAVNAVPSAATAFPHRDQLFCTQNAVFLSPADSAATRQRAVDWVTGLAAQMAPFTSGGAFINYIDGSQANWQQAYYGANLARLRSIKRTYDPGNVFSFPQAIPG